MKLAKCRKLQPKKPKYSLTELLAQIPDTEHYKALVRSDEVLRAWGEMIPVGREFGATDRKPQQQ
ncbi:hypothetical protein [uncultured Propionivibrio sp.]|uniref:hypothetical protein n=1 Tax=uncultured Propionivibrio sp. TaxID=426737 RepID=UPI0029C0E672|nr:hypothetical protein [uncultured Propionivibrio sp.]